jgi:hypothetical protein
VVFCYALNQRHTRDKERFFRASTPTATGVLSDFAESFGFVHPGSTLIAKQGCLSRVVGSYCTLESGKNINRSLLIMAVSDVLFKATKELTEYLASGWYESCRPQIEKIIELNNELQKELDAPPSRLAIADE